MEKHRILIVDDTPKNIQLAASVLGQEPGFELLFATSGQQALQLAGENDLDLILLDVMMPEMDGFETCRTLKADEKNRQVPVIFLTAKTEPEAMAQGFETGGVDYVLKPFNAPELLARVKTHLSLREARLRLEMKLENLVEESRKKAKNIMQTRLKVQEQHSEKMKQVQGELDGLTRALVEKEQALENVREVEERFAKLKKANEELAVRLREKAGKNAILTELRRELARGNDFEIPFTLAAVRVDNYDLAKEAMDRETIRVMLSTPLKTLMEEELHPYDLLMGPEEGVFYLLLFATEEQEGAQRIKKIQELQHARHRRAGEFVVSLSCGLTQSREGDDPSAVLERTEAALKEALDKGRNTITVK